MILDLFLLTIIITWIIDCSGIIDSLEKGLSKWLKCKVLIPKPFSCSLCSSWWCGLLYLIITQNFTLLGIAYITVLCQLTPCIGDIFVLVRETINYIIGKGFNNLR